MRYVLIAAAFGLSAPLSGCTSDNMDYVGAFQPGYYNAYGLPLNFNGYQSYRSGSYSSGYRIHQGQGFHGGELRRLR
ncbi:hypothetical protein [Mesorhizobium sp. ANAO-SY3R2]|uniref:hypothetical protein n=1 Tax=Mesorhizobium sp. ANAO-SY3R2 TaxID=3166644 RepID=UPI0036705C60